MTISGPPGFNSLTFVAPASGFVVEYSSCFISVSNLDLYVTSYIHCFDSLMSRSPSRGPNNLYVNMDHSITHVYMNYSITQGEVERS